MTGPRDDPAPGPAPAPDLARIRAQVRAVVEAGGLKLGRPRPSPARIAALLAQAGLEVLNREGWDVDAETNPDNLIAVRDAATRWLRSERERNALGTSTDDDECPF